MGTLKHICMALAFAGSALAQSAAKFEPGDAPSGPVPQGVKPEKSEPAPAAATAASDNAATPARFVGPDTLETYLKSMVSVFSAMKREKDPFGQYQDPETKPEVTVVKQGIARRAPVQATPLSEIVGYLPITTIMPSENSFLIGTRKVEVGQEVPLIWRGKPLRVEVTRVSSTLIAFRDVESGETGTRTMDILPIGMSVGGGLKEITTPGMVPDRPNAPIELGGGDMTMAP